MARSRPVEGPPLWQTPWVTQLAKQIVGAGLVLLVAFLVLRPLMKSLTKPGSRQSAGADGGDLPSDRVSLSGQGGKAIKLSAEFRAADRGGPHPGRAGSEACRASREGLGRRRWLTMTSSPGPNAPRSCS